MSERVGLCEDFKPVMSLVQSPLATSSGVGSCGLAIQQRRQDTIRYDCNRGCDNHGVHKGLVFTVIVMQSLLSFCKSTVFYRTPAPIIVYYFPYITCLLYLLFLIKHVRTSG